MTSGESTTSSPICRPRPASKKVEEAAAEAGEQSEGEGAEAREKAAERAKELDPQERRDFNKPDQS